MGEIDMSGRTTRQMMNAPEGAVYVWCETNVFYAVELAWKLNRRDLVIKPFEWLMVPIRGLHDRAIVIDHRYNFKTLVN